MGRLDGKVAIITGATSGMGRDTAYVFAEEGAKVMITGRNEDRAKEVVEKITEAGGIADYVIADLADQSCLQGIIDKTLEVFETIDIMFYNAGMLTVKSVLEIPEEEWNKVMDVNVNSAFLLCRAAAKIMKAKGEGSIIITSSIAGTAAKWGPSAYGTSKHAVNGLVKVLARELGPEIRANGILPGAIRTAMLDSAGGDEAMEPMRQMSPLKRLGEGREIGKTALFFATEDSSYITGQLLRVDGGVDC